MARFYKSKKNHVITTQTEHKCVLDSCRQLEHEGFEVTYLPVGTNGRVDIEEFKASIRPTTGIFFLSNYDFKRDFLNEMSYFGIFWGKFEFFLLLFRITFSHLKV